MSFMGTSRSFVKTDRGAVSFGVLDLSSLLDLGLDFAAGDLEMRELKGESVRPRVERPERVRTPSLAAVLERGVGGF